MVSIAPRSFAQNLSAIGQFTFTSAHGGLLQAHTDGEMHASQDVQNPGLEERWNVYARPAGIVCLQNYRTNRWLCAEPSGRAVCDRTNPGPWEDWRLHASGDGRSVSLLGAHGRWLVAQPPGQNTQWGGEVAADRASAGPWERFSMVPSADVPIRNKRWLDDVINAINVAKQVVPIVVAIVAP